MTGPEHYQEAERLVSPRTVQSLSGREMHNVQPTLETILQAQVHATLALAAATAMNGHDETGMPKSDFRAWDVACGKTPGVDDG